MTYKEKINHILTMLKKHGYEEHFPPSRSCWYFKKGEKRVALHWPTSTTLAYFDNGKKV